MEIKIVRQILEWNENCHLELQGLFDENKILMINIMGSPGGGKTTFITRLIEALRDEYNIGVIEGDVAGQVDAEKIQAMGIPVVQLNTDGACHIEAMSIKNILPYFDLKNLDIIIVENIGNLVCPAEFDIGEHLKIALLSVPEGDDKVEKYPLMFTRSNALVISKYDMKNYFNFDDNRVISNAKRLNSELNIFKVNSSVGEGMVEIVEYIKSHIKK
ncbi:hydrogenase nickel incorporation protein HypB [Clostridium sp. YIM B02515]|uniref:Hydrogenase nickel incorporation protein HypB n=1 Tax=Clostridium rhizosphaerae TaxID=2803861 RepID=A0ABS1TFU9_9CLOT|nr:hydrogenase nickel incorporation protein HypB [Clostridium rhizosphaerae]MBL4937962.1 hydrogenase nickel incorporation protein HypB [Clostridium rhizosphaerae]